MQPAREDGNNQVMPPRPAAFPSISVEAAERAANIQLREFPDLGHLRAVEAATIIWGMASTFDPGAECHSKCVMRDSEHHVTTLILGINLSDEKRYHELVQCLKEHMDLFPDALKEIPIYIGEDSNSPHRILVHKGRVEAQDGQGAYAPDLAPSFDIYDIDSNPGRWLQAPVQELKRLLLIQAQRAVGRPGELS